MRSSRANATRKSSPRSARHRCKKSAAEIASALKGDWKVERLFTLRQSLAAWRFNHQLADECLAEIHRLASKLESQTDATPPPPAKRGKQPDAAVRTLALTIPSDGSDGVFAPTANIVVDLGLAPTG